MYAQTDLQGCVLTSLSLATSPPISVLIRLS